MQVQGLDFAQQMLADAERRQQSRHAACSQRCARMEWVQGDALELPFPGADIPCRLALSCVRSQTCIYREGLCCLHAAFCSAPEFVNAYHLRITAMPDQYPVSICSSKQEPSVPCRQDI